MAGADSTSLSADASRKPTLTAVFALGGSCVITQLALMREMLGVFAGNELVLGVVLGNWLLLMGLGASLGRWARRWEHSPGLLIGLLLFTAVVPPLQIVALRGLRQFVFLRGEAIGVVGTVLASLLVLLPYCVAAGLFLALACGALAGRGAAAGAGRVYAMDSLGGVAGGALFSFVLVRRLDHVALLGWPAALNVLAAAWLAWRARSVAAARQSAANSLSPRRRRSAETPLREWRAWPAGTLPLALTLAVGAGLFAWMLLARPDVSSTARQFPGQRLLFRGNSPYGRLIVTASGGQTNFIENGVVVAFTPNLEQAEESVHFALAQRPGAQRVLLIGGALSGAPREILRYRVTALDDVELDPLVAALGRRFLPAEFNDPRLRLYEADARQFVRRAGANYDVVIVALPDPTTAQLNRFFTQEFFQEVRRVLRPGGVLSFAVGRYENYAGPELSRLLSCARQTAARSFHNVLLLPGGRTYFLASDGPLTTDLAPALERSGVATRWVTRPYLAAALAPDRLADLERAAAPAAPVNRDFAPVLYYLHLRYWASQFEGGWRWPALALGVVAAVYWVRLRGAAGVIFASGFAGSALEMILLLTVQILTGAVYRQLAWVVTLFMAGLAVGAVAATRWLEKPPPGTGRSGAWQSAADQAGEFLRRSAEPPPGETSRVQPSFLLCLLALGVAAFAMLLPVVLPALARLAALGAGGTAMLAIVLGFTFGLAALVGAQFPLANALATGGRHAAARLYTADFVGASIGALLTSVWLLPAGGVAGVGWITGGLNLLAALGVLSRKRSRCTNST
jgi:spermidine synthase